MGDARYFGRFRASSVRPLAGRLGVVRGDMAERLLRKRQFASALHLPDEQDRYADQKIDRRRRR